MACLLAIVVLVLPVREIEYQAVEDIPSQITLWVVAWGEIGGNERRRIGRLEKGSVATQ